ncbi:lysozyme C-like [Aquarana catesbeiana]|uniref:lysozyme C-like n=1 Tax=Aquarana catesbeiana TaxID=8400 RepID=UPI003CC9D865
MKVILFLALCLYLSYGSEGRKLSKCEFVKIAKSKLNGYAGSSAADWVCLVQHESNFETTAINHNGKQSTDYGLFQINSKYWCHDGKTARATNGCGIECSKLQDDNLEDDIQCAKKIAGQAKGLSPWMGWKSHCKGKNLASYTSGC